KLRQILQVTQEMVVGPRTADIFPWMSWIHRFDGEDTQLNDNFEQLDKPTPESEDFVDVLLRLQKDPSQSISL
ncbi:hypothetical protein MKX03_027488, partial [Papaver bracteatum]